MSDIKNFALSDEELDEVFGGAGYMHVKLDSLQQQFEKACTRHRLKDVMEIAGELQARGYLGWAKQTARAYGITCI